MDPATPESPTSGLPDSRRQRGQEEKMPPHHVPWRDETGGVNTGYDIAGTYATNAGLEEEAALPSLYFLLEVAHQQQRREIEADFALRMARMVQEKDDLRRQLRSLEAAKLEGVKKQAADRVQNISTATGGDSSNNRSSTSSTTSSSRSSSSSSNRSAASSSLAMASACPKAERDKIEASLREPSASGWNSARMREEEIKGSRIDPRERLRRVCAACVCDTPMSKAEGEDTDSQVAASGVEQEKAANAFAQQFKVSDAQMASDETGGMIEVDLKNDEAARRADSTAREACDHDRQHSQLQGCRPKGTDQMSDEQPMETKQISDDEDGEWVDVEEMDSGSNDFFKLGVPASREGNAQSVHSGTCCKCRQGNAELSAEEALGVPAPAFSRLKPAVTAWPAESVQMELNTVRKSTSAAAAAAKEEIEAVRERADTATAAANIKVQALAAELCVAKRRLRLTEEELRDSIDAEVEAVSRLFEAEETAACLRQELEACKRQVAELLRKAQAAPGNTVRSSHSDK